MVKLNHVSVWLVCGDQHRPATEYLDDEAADEDQPRRNLTRLVEVQSNETWSARIRVHEDFDWQGANIVAVKLWIDGKRACKVALTKNRHQPGQFVHGGIRHMTVVSGEDVKFLQFRFADLETSKSKYHDGVGSG